MAAPGISALSRCSSRTAGIVPALLAAFSFCGFAAHHAGAQEQERKLMDRILKPNEQREFGAHKSFNGASLFRGRGSAYVKDFYTPQKFNAKNYMAGAYSGQKAWKGDFVYKTNEADTKGRDGVRRVVREYGTKEMPVKTSREAGKTHESRTYATRESNWRGRSQDKIDLQGPGAVTTIRDGSFTELKTIDDVRDLLNKK